MKGSHKFKRDIASNDTNSTLEILALTAENVTSLDSVQRKELSLATRTDHVHPDLAERDWSSIETWVIAYAAGGAVLHAIQEHTNFGVVRKVYRAYASVGYQLASFIRDVAIDTYRIFPDSQFYHWTTAFTSEGAMREGSTMGLIEVRELVETLAKRSCVSGDPSWCAEFTAPCVKSDYCTSSKNHLGYSDTKQWWDWSYWYGQEMTKSANWGTSFLHIQWDLGLSSYWVASASTRPNTADSTMSYEDCDAAPW